MNHHPKAITQIELLILISIVALLVAILLPTLGAARSTAKQTHELSNLRQIMLAFIADQEDHDGHVMWGYPPVLINGVPTTAREHDGGILTNLEAQRYPWRLAPYLENACDLLYSNANLATLPQSAAYQFSIFPSFGLNTTYVGGHDGSPRQGFVADASGAKQPNRGAHVVFRNDEVRNASGLIVFVETQNRLGDGPFNFLLPPGQEPIHDGRFFLNPQKL
ncbi:MAG: type II secretion system protein [Planctomycetota bacterium]